jgi:hypothetical protein
MHVYVTIISNKLWYSETTNNSGRYLFKMLCLLNFISKGSIKKIVFLNRRLLQAARA